MKFIEKTYNLKFTQKQKANRWVASIQQFTHKEIRFNPKLHDRQSMIAAFKI